MKIIKVELVNFRGFPGSAVYDFEFGNASNLFVYGENGSGKSSLFLAFQEFFNNRKGAKPFTDFKNTVDATINDGRVTVYFDDGSVHAWPDGADRPLKATPVAQIAMQVGCFDYRSLLETNFTHKGDEVNLFMIAVETLVPNMEVTVAGKSARIGDLWRRVLSTMPRTHHVGNLRKSESALKLFNDGFEPVVAPLLQKATELLIKHFDPRLELNAAYDKVRYERASRTFANTKLSLSVERNGSELLQHHNILNEARLSAIGLVIYLAGLLISMPAKSAFAKVLVLDDVLVGLDMGNRLPVLSILKEYFADWQIVLLTHDRIWYEMVQADIEPTTWRAYELWLAGDGTTPIHRPREGGPDFFLDRARRHLADNDDRAAGVYARAAFETKVNKYCEFKSVPVPYKRDPKDLKIESAWIAAKERAMADADAATKAILEPLFNGVNLAKKVILNPLSHSAPQTVTTVEIQTAIDAVAALRFK